MFKQACFAAKAGWCTSVVSTASWNNGSAPVEVGTAFGFCFDPVCCDGGVCALADGTSDLIESGLSAFLHSHCSNGSASHQSLLCPTGNVSYTVSTTCAGGSSLLWWTMLGVGGAVLLCFCVIVAARFSFFHCTRRGRAARRARHLSDLLEQMLAEGGAAREEQAQVERQAAIVRVQDAARHKRNFVAGQDDQYGLECIVCLESLAGMPDAAAPGAQAAGKCTPEVISFPSCKHVFHASCLLEWLAQKPTCPVCRTTWPECEAAPPDPQPSSASHSSPLIAASHRS